MKRIKKSGSNRFSRFGLKQNVGRTQKSNFRGGVRQ